MPEPKFFQNINELNRQTSASIKEKELPVIKEKLSFLEGKMTPQQIQNYGQGLLLYGKMISVFNNFCGKGLVPERFKGWFGLDEDELKEVMIQKRNTIFVFLEGIELGLTEEEKNKAREALNVSIDSDNKDIDNLESFLEDNNVMFSSKEIEFESKEDWIEKGKIKKDTSK